jgi:hypothetical protein
MLTLIAICLVTFIVSASVLWAYRKLSVWHGFTETLEDRPQSKTRMKIGAQQGKKAKNVKLRSPKGKIEDPWGW